MKKMGVKHGLQLVLILLLLISDLLRESKKRHYIGVILFEIFLKPIKNFKKIKTELCSIFNSLKYCVCNNLPYWISHYFILFKCIYACLNELYCF